MKYEGIQKGVFLERPNRFIARVELSGTVETVHVKNTGRCKELLIPGTTVYVQEQDKPGRRTKYDLIAVEKGSLLINMDSQAPNRVAAEYLPSLLSGLTLLRPETSYGSSRFDFYAEAAGEKWFIEVKGVTLEEQGIARFPDAPTLRGIKHLEELTGWVKEGHQGMLLFIVQMKGISHVEANMATHPEFGKALSSAASAGVLLKGVDCMVTPHSLTAHTPVPVLLPEKG